MRRQERLLELLPQGNLHLKATDWRPPLPLLQAIVLRATLVSMAKWLVREKWQMNLARQQDSQLRLEQGFPFVRVRARRAVWRVDVDRDHF